MLCRSLRHNLEAGLTITHIFRQQSERGPTRIRPVAGRIHDVLKQGYELSEALKEEQGTFPPLFAAMVHMGEATGTLPAHIQRTRSPAAADTARSPDPSPP